MLTFDARRLSGSLSTVEVEIIVTSTTGSNLHTVTVFGARRAALRCWTLPWGAHHPSSAAVSQAESRAIICPS